ncbi:hypothetical protein RVR_3205 [Actinacidiphila reveromycinica]|uniref:Uncharacterized protein n=1 Tax=Actinacidiphila reveromycinica TaxID=659352 RepID=A0A7U3URL5_9ACTN|nr:hypothetical protein [Streptomyces sp. SN-593]BBA97448.1 hypothetical protein RVR_3205 [Streptomyces sp. SN-593]
MVRPDDGGGDFSGIDPQKLWDMIGSIKSRAGDDGSARSLVNGWMGQANRIGLDTSRLTKINTHFTWAQDQVPMLQRRHSLAVDGAKEQQQFGSTGMVGAGASSLGNYPTTAAAQKGAQDDAQQWKDGKISAQEYYKRLQANEFDPDYCKAAADALGPTRLQELEQESFAADPDHEDSKVGITTLATVVATAMRNGFDLKESTGFKEEKVENIQLLAGLVPYATFPSDVLVDLGKQSLAPGNYMYGKAIWPALAADPAAATRFLHDDMAYIPEWMKGDSDHHGGLPDDQAGAFAEVVKAGTIPGPGADADMAADNTTKLIQYYAKNPDNHTHEEIQGVFDQDIAYYFSDLQSSLTDPVHIDLGPGHVTASSEEWQAFTGEGMLNPEAGGKLYAFAAQQADELARDNPDDAVAVHGAGVLEGFFSQEAHNVYQQEAQDYKDGKGKWQNSFKDNAKLGVSMAIDFSLDPQGTLKSEAVDGVKNIIDLGIDHWPSDSAPAPKDPGQISWGHDWESSAKDYYREHGKFPPVTTSDGITWTGDPKEYAQEYGCPEFIDADGNLRISGSAAQQAKERTAYNAWLKDPAVGKVIAQGGPFIQRDLGRHDGQDLAGD